MTKSRPRSAAEEAVRRDMAPLLARFEPVYDTCDEVLRHFAGLHTAEDAAVAAQQEMSSSPLRLGNVLLRIWRLVEAGYLMQAASLAATAIESAVGLVVIGRNDDAAREWLKWDDPQHLPWSVKRGTQLAKQSSGGGIDAYPWYRLFCQCKHANPTIQRELQPALSVPSLLGVVTGRCSHLERPGWRRGSSTCLCRSREMHCCPWTARRWRSRTNRPVVSSKSTWRK